MSEIRVENIIGETGTDAVKFTKGINATGIVTATSFAGSGAALTGISAGNTNGMQVLEEFYVPCNGTAVTMAQGSVAIQNVTTAQVATDTMTDVTGSQITYQPPANTKLVIYTFSCMVDYTGGSGNGSIFGFQPYLDGVRLSSAPTSFRVNQYFMDFYHFVHGFRIESTADASIGQVTSWNSTKTIKLQYRRWSNTFPGRIHGMGEGLRSSDGLFDNNVFRMPNVGIKAIGSV